MGEKHRFKRSTCPVCTFICNENKSDLELCATCGRECHTNCVAQCPHKDAKRNAQYREWKKKA